jgi:hypothetical protein
MLRWISVIAFLMAVACGQDLILTQDETQASVVRVSTETGRTQVLLKGLPTLDVAREAAGSLLLLGRHSLNRLDKQGNLSPIVSNYPGVNWVSMAPHKDGSVITADVERQLLWRITLDGKVSVFSKMDDYPYVAASVGLAAVPNGFLWLRETHHNALRLAAVDWNGKLTLADTSKSLRGRGPSLTSFDSVPTVALSHGKLRSDGAGGCYFVDRASLGLYYINPDLEIRRLATVSKASANVALFGSDSVALDDGNKRLFLIEPSRIRVYDAQSGREIRQSLPITAPGLVSVPSAGIVVDRKDD